jgi:hypothetical protein
MSDLTNPDCHVSISAPVTPTRVTSVKSERCFDGPNVDVVDAMARPTLVGAFLSQVASAVQADIRIFSESKLPSTTLQT